VLWWLLERLDRTEISADYMGRGIPFSLGGESVDFPFGIQREVSAVPNSVAHRPVPVPMSKTLWRFDGSGARCNAPSNDNENR
jgi:hypothetical protein